jgi:hypothetical protein
MEFGEVPMAVIFAVVSKLLDDKALAGPPRLRAIVLSTRSIHYDLIPVLNDRLISIPRDILRHL